MDRKLQQWSYSAVVVSLLFTCTSELRAGEHEPTADAIRQAVSKSLPLLELGARGSMAERKQCFTCHNQGLGILAMTAARSRGFEIDEEHLGEQLSFIATFLAKNQDDYLKGDGQGGQVDTAGYALWTLSAGGRAGDEVTAAVAEYFLIYQREKDHWDSISQRPPSEQSAFTATYLALRGLKHYGTAQQQERIAARIEHVKPWLLSTTPVDTEDRVFRLRALRVVDAPQETLDAAVAELRGSQRHDGGWAQLDALQSDAYATGSALVALHEDGGLTTDDPVFRRGLSFLIGSQLEDGSWHVASRSKPFQIYFESGYPHGKDQFISMAAAGWATQALVFALPRKVEVQ